MPDGEKAFTKPGVVAYATLLMPVLKKALTAEGYCGELSPEAYGALCAIIAVNLGLAPSPTLPKR